MTISNIQQLHDLAETSLASYATLDPLRDLKDALMSENTGG